jgi:hypothetical protein
MAEVEAESTAWTVMRAYAIDADVSSFAYIASWSKGDVDLLSKTAERVVNAARTILSELPEPERAVDLSPQNAQGQGVELA